MNSFGNSRVTDLVAAIQQGNGEYVNLLLGLGVPPDQLDFASGLSALRAAVQFAPNLLPRILAHCMHPDSALVLGGTALSYVVHELGEGPDPERQKSLFEAAGQLLKAGAKPWIRDTDQAPLALARLYGLAHVEKLLLEYA